MKIVKITIAILLIGILASAAYIFYNRQELFNQSIDRVLTNLLPDYIKLDELYFDFDKKSITIKGFKIKNPEGFNHPYLAEIPLISCNYEQQDRANIFKGIRLSRIRLSDPRLYIDRRRDGAVSIQQMDKVLKSSSPSKAAVKKGRVPGLFSYILSPVKNIDQLLRVEPVFDISSGTLVFDDSFIDKGGFITTINEAAATVTLSLRKGFKGITYLKSRGKGIVNAKKGQYLHWDTEYDPAAEKLTMLNRFIVENIDITHFEVYYERFSPFIINGASVSGELIINFDNGNIGSANEIRFSNLEIEPKQDHNFNRFWPSGTEDLYTYFSNSGGEVIFDFKVKGPVAQPKFYLGSKTKHALAQMVVYKIADTILNKDENQETGRQQSSDVPQRKKSDVEKVLDILKNL